MSHQYNNDLLHENSPYLLQHAYNPVNWVPWSEEAFEKARKENKLVLVSIGYSACHWCHVMERESFEDTTIAEYMNEHFISIKVDREERPDVDQVYMNAVQLMTQSGGWPLNCFTLGDGRPIYGGTYFPKDQWMNVLKSLVDLKNSDPDKMEEYASRLTQGVQQSELLPRAESASDFPKNGMDEIVEAWRKSWDMKEGGPNRAPKFPLPNNYEFLLHFSELREDEQSRDFVKLSLKKMAFGGIYDQIGGGFARYSTDALWKVPHFEKMLYDNGQLIGLYARAFKKFGDEEFKKVVQESILFLEKEMLSPSGGFYSALDADSEGEEGKFYIWTKDELVSILGDDFPFVEDYYNINRKGLWEHNQYILLRSQSLEDFAEDSGQSLSELKKQDERVKEILWKEREKRIRPGLDHKILCSWNAMTITGLCQAYDALGDEKYLQIALRTIDFIQKQMYQNDGSLFRNFTGNEAEINAYLDDYAFLIEAFISLYQCTFEEKWLSEARQLSDYCLDHFYDDQSGMFWYTSDIDPPLIARKQEIMDNVIPASNSVMAKNLFKLGTVLDREYYLNLSRQMLSNVLPHMDYGQSFSNWGLLQLMISHPFFEVAITGDDCLDLRAEISNKFLPNVLYLGGKTQSQIPLLKGKFLDKTTIFVCVDHSCRLPVSKSEEALKQIYEYP